MDFTIIPSSLSYETESALLQLESLKIILQDSAPDCTKDTPDLKNYLLELHTQLVYKITGLLQDQYMSQVDLDNLSLDNLILTA